MKLVNRNKLLDLGNPSIHVRSIIDVILFKMCKILVVFDFDHTLIDGNSDTHIKNLSCEGELPPDLESSYEQIGWNEYMNQIFKFLHSHCKVIKKDYVDSLKKLPLVDAMSTVLNLITSPGYEAIIISDSNSFFIDSILENYNLEHVFKKIYTNPAYFDNKGCLTIDYYHHQTHCPLSTVNMCKKQILEEHIQKASAEGISYSKVVFIGDGSNDLCPAFTLKDNDYILARKDYHLHKKILKVKDKIIANIAFWSDGADILKILKPLRT